MCVFILLSAKDIDIKKVNGAPQYAFLQYCDIASVCKAIKKMDGEYLGNNRLKVSNVKLFYQYFGAPFIFVLMEEVIAI